MIPSELPACFTKSCNCQTANKSRIKEFFAAGKLAELSLFQALQLQTTGQKDETEKTLSSPQSAVIGFKPPCFLFITKG